MAQGPENYDKTLKWLGNLDDRQLRTRRDKIRRDLDSGFIYSQHFRTMRTRSGDGYVWAWMNAEIARRIWANRRSTAV